MTTALRLGLVLLLLAVLGAPAAAAGKRYVLVVNDTDMLVGVGFVQPPSAANPILLFELGAKSQRQFTLDAGMARIIVKGRTKCHFISMPYEMLPTHDNVTVNVKGCRLRIQ
jgi:hypothetical protein